MDLSDDPVWFHRHLNEMERTERSQPLSPCLQSTKEENVVSHTLLFLWKFVFEQERMRRVDFWYTGLLSWQNYLAARISNKKTDVKILPIHTTWNTNWHSRNALWYLLCPQCIVVSMKQRESRKFFLKIELTFWESQSSSFRVFCFSLDFHIQYTDELWSKTYYVLQLHPYSSILIEMCDRHFLGWIRTKRA